MRFFQRRKHATAATWEQRLPAAALVYRDEDGRRRRGDAPYLLPKDEKEVGRLDYQHFVLRQVLKGNSYAPVHRLLLKGGPVLDVGCGTGRWGCEVATDYPQTQVIGFDLEDVPRSTIPPANYHFVQGNVLHGLPFADHTFTYVHQRLLVAGLPLDIWPWEMEELKRVTCPGGWVELIEMGNTFHHAGPATTQFLNWWAAISASRGIDATKMAEIGLFLQRAGFSHIHTTTKRIPVGRWGGRIGHLLAQNILAGWPSIRPLAHTQLGVLPDVFDEVIGRLEAEWNSAHTSYDVYFACGQV